VGFEVIYGELQDSLQLLELKFAAAEFEARKAESRSYRAADVRNSLPTRMLQLPTQMLGQDYSGVRDQRHRNDIHFLRCG